MLHFVQLALSFATAAAALGLCVAACQRALAILAGQVRVLRGARSLGAGVMLGAATWAQMLIWPGFPLDTRADLAGDGVALAVALAGGVLACAAYRRSKGAVRWIAGGAILGAGAAASRLSLMASLGSDVEFDDIMISGYLGLSSAASVAAFATFAFARRPNPRSRLAAAACMGLGLTLPAALGTGAVMIYAPVAGGVATASLVMIAAAAKLGLIALSYWPEAGAAPARPATTAPAWRGSRPPSPARIPAGTGSLRPQPARSAAARAASPERRALRAD